jgi:adenosine 3'-phospho 5'-phosphosulfate transporter B2
MQQVPDDGQSYSPYPTYRSNGNLADIIFALSVNFLLYVLLIIVFYMIVRFYLEEEVTTAYKDGYHLVSTDEVETHEDAGTSILEEETQQQAQKLNKEVIVDSPPPKRTGSLEDKDLSPNVFRTASSEKPGRSSFLHLHEWGEPEGTKQEVLQKLVICSLGLTVSFSIWGLVQERILTQTYDGEFFVYSYGLVFMNRLGGFLLSLVLMYYFQVEWFPSALWEYSFPSVTNMLSSWCQYEALKYVSFPMVMLGKAFKMVPIMLMGKFMNNKSFESYEYISGALVGFGLYLFLDSTEKLDLSTNVFGDPENIRGAMCGVVLLIFFLFFDSFTGQWQTRMFTLNPLLSPLQMMLIMNIFSTIFSFITLVHQEELFVSQMFVYHHPQMIFHLVIFAICSTVGQLFIFYTVKHFGAVVFSIIMSIRILFSTLLSCFVYNHPITEMGFVGIVIVCLATGYRLMKKTEGKPLIRWKDTEQDSSIFKEWHEHLDI